MNLYRHLDAWLIEEGYWIKHSSMRKFQRVKKIEGDLYGTRIFHLDSIGVHNNMTSITASRYDSIECKYRRVRHKQFPDETYADFRL